MMTMILGATIHEQVDKFKPNGGTEKGVSNMVTIVLDVMFWGVGIIAVIMIIVGGVMYSSSMGDPGRVKKAKDMIMYGIIGLAIALLAFAIVRTITGIFS